MTTTPTDAHVADIADNLVGAANHHMLDAIGSGDPAPVLTQAVLTELASHTAFLPHDVVDLLRRLADHIETELPTSNQPARPRFVADEFGEPPQAAVDAVLAVWASCSPYGDPSQPLKCVNDSALNRVDNLARLAAKAVLEGGV